MGSLFTENLVTCLKLFIGLFYLNWKVSSSLSFSYASEALGWKGVWKDNVKESRRVVILKDEMMEYCIF